MATKSRKSYRKEIRDIGKNLTEMITEAAILPLIQVTTDGSLIARVHNVILAASAVKLFQKKVLLKASRSL